MSRIIVPADTKRAAKSDMNLTTESKVLFTPERLSKKKAGKNQSVLLAGEEDGRLLSTWVDCGYLIEKGLATAGQELAPMTIQFEDGKIMD